MTDAREPNHGQSRRRRGREVQRSTREVETARTRRIRDQTARVGEWRRLVPDHPASNDSGRNNRPCSYSVSGAG